MIRRYIGLIACKPEGDKLRIMYNGRALGVIDSVRVQDEDGSPIELFAESLEVKTIGHNWRRWYGCGTVFERTFVGAGRTITETISITNDKIHCVHEVVYASTIKVKKHHCMIRLCNVRGTDIKWISCDGVAYEADMQTGVLKMIMDDGDYTPNMVINHDATVTDTNYNSRSGTIVYSYLISAAPLPVVLSSKGGTQSTITWSIHADISETPITKAIYYGSSNENGPNYGVKGFCSRNLKTTQSVFAIERPLGEGLWDETFKSIIDKIHEDGCEIIPHTILNGANSRQDVIDGLPLYEEYGSANWIDHSLGSGGVSSGIKSKGWDKTSEFYIMDLLKEYGYKYCWSYRDYNVFTQMSGGINMFKPNTFGLPKHVLYQNTNLSFEGGEQMWQWHSWRRDAGKLLETLTVPVIDRLIAEMGYSQIHEYFLSAQLNHFYEEDNGEYNITNKFDMILAHLQQMQTAGLLWHPTVIEFAEHFIKLTRVSVQPTLNGVKLTNSSGGIIDGFTVLCPDYWGEVNTSVASQTRGTGSGKIIWMDLPPGETEIITGYSND